MTPAPTPGSDRLELAELDGLGLPAPRIERLLWAFAALGIGLRTLFYLLRFPIWTDEAKLATSLLDRGYAGLVEPLAYGQIATVGFLWIQKTVTVVLGFSELSLRLVPFLAAIAGVLVMRHLASRLLGGPPAVFAMALFAVSYYPIRHGAELKPYATDLLASLVLTAIAVEWLREPHRTRWLWLLAAAAPAALAVSYPATFAAAGILAALAIPVWRQRHWRVRLTYLTAALLAAAAFGANFFFAAARQAAARAAGNLPWKGGFPPTDDLPGALLWLLQAHTGRTFGYPLGGENGGSLLTFAAVVAGAVVLFKAGRRRLLAVLLLPFAAGIGAAVLERYPYGGSGRVSQYLVPAICLLAGLGAARLSSLARRAASRRRGQAGILVFLAVFGILLGAAAILRPYRDRPDRTGRDFARWFWDVKPRDAEVVSAWEDLALDFARPPDGWTPGGAGYRINQRIYSQRLRRGNPADLARVSRERPLRVVFLGSALAGQGEAFAAWLDDMQRRYELTGSEHHRLGGFQQQHGRGDWIEVYTFVPRGPIESDVPRPARSPG